MCRMRILIALIVLQTTVCAAGTFSVLARNVTVLVGESATLPCWLSPSTDAQDMDVRFYRVDYNDPVFLYSGRRVENPSQEFQNRTAFTSPESTGLNQGNVSITISQVRLQDSGKYNCYVASNEHYDSEKLFLKVEVLGSPPVLSLKRTEDNKVNVSCVSEGWKPRPHLQWSKGTGQQPLPPDGLSYGEGADGLAWVRSWVTRPAEEEESWVSCSVLLPARMHDRREGRVDTHMGSSHTESSVPWLAAFVITLMLLVGLLLLLAFYWRRQRTQKERIPLETQEEEPLMQKTTDPDNMKKHAVDVTIQDPPSCLKVVANGKVLRDNDQTRAEDWERCVMGKSDAQEGQLQCYWEVGLKKPNTPVKLSWWVGVATESAMTALRKHKCIPVEGFYCLFSDPELGLHIKSGSTAHVFHAPKPEKLGVFLDYCESELSFYDTNRKQHLVTIKANFREVFPLFNPGKSDLSPLEILPLDKSAVNQAPQKPKQSE